MAGFSSVNVATLDLSIIIKCKKNLPVYNTVLERPIHTSKTAKIILLGLVDRTNLTNQFVASTRPSKMIYAVLDVWIGRSYTVL